MKKEDKKMFWSLLLWALVPSVYLLIRMKIVSINNVDINILGNMEWFDLIDEVLVTALTVPLYSLLKPGKTSKERNGAAFLISFSVYLLFTVIIAFRIGSISKIMNAENAAQYLFLQTFAMLASFVSTFCVLIFTLNADFQAIHLLLILKVVLMAITDFLMIHSYGDIGAAYSEILVNLIVSLLAFMSVTKGREYLDFKGLKNGFDAWLKDYGRIGLFAGLQIFLDNFIYAVMVCRMVNAVAETGNYWIANNFIWGWLLMPVTCFAEIIKKNSYEEITWENTWKYGVCIFCACFATIPLWRWFINTCMAVEDVDAVLSIICTVIPFYVAYGISAFLDAWFISKGRTEYLTVISFVVNVAYYGFVFIMFKEGMFLTNITFICTMFGVGMLVHCLMSAICYQADKVRKILRN